MTKSIGQTRSGSPVSRDNNNSYPIINIPWNAHFMRFVGKEFSQDVKFLNIEHINVIIFYQQWKNESNTLTFIN